LKKRKQDRKEGKNNGVMASRRKTMKELGRLTFSSDTTSGGGSSRGSLREGQRGRAFLFINEDRKDENETCGKRHAHMYL
jgi:hypothetical protein